MWLIMSPAKTFFTGTWLEKTPPVGEWTPDVQLAWQMDTKDIALEYVRTHVEAFRTADGTFAKDKLPEFIGARVVSLGFLAVLELRKMGYKAREVDGGLLLDFNPRGVLMKKALAALPKEVMGIPIVKVLANGKPPTKI